ncbi:MAG: hypothetical protein H8E37_11160 [Planctomycetes bacterium]|nr:hypothetical protein [Planctomycetota bacterium]
MLRSLTLLALGLLIATPTFADEADVRARKIIDRAIKAIGGKKALNKTRVMLMEEAGTYYGMGQGVPYTGRYYMAMPNRTRFEIQNAFLIIRDGKKGWMSTQGVTTPLTEAQIKEQLLEAHCQNVASLRPLAKANKKLKLTLAGEEEIEGEACDGINIDAEGQRQTQLYFSRKTGLLKRTSYVVAPEELGGKEVVDSILHLDYKEVDGVQVSMTQKITRDGKKFVEGKMTKVEFPEKADDAEFAKPE